jgi:DNA-binding IclR family transcriptional regulator
MTDESPMAVQSISRAANLLRMIAGTSDGTARLMDLVTWSGLKKPTVRRILVALEENGFVERDENHLYRIGGGLVSIGLGAANRWGFVDVAGPLCQETADLIGDTVYLFRYGSERLVCIQRVQGAYPIKALSLDVGDERPLGVGAAGLAVLAEVHDEDDDERLARFAEDCLPFWPTCTPSALHAACEAARAKGYSYNPGYIVEGLHAVGVALRNQSGDLIGAVSVAGVAARYSSTHVDRIVRQLEKVSQAVRESSLPPS